jgi:hypothetical protein
LGSTMLLPASLISDREIVISVGQHMRISPLSRSSMLYSASSRNRLLAMPVKLQNFAFEPLL